MSFDVKLGALDAAIAALKATVNEQYGGQQDEVKGQYSFNTWLERRVTIWYDAEPGDEHTDFDVQVTAMDTHPLMIEEQDSVRDECIQNYMDRRRDDD